MCDSQGAGGFREVSLAGDFFFLEETEMLCF